MNRNAEYEALRRQLESPPAETAGCFARAMTRERRRLRAVRGFGGLAAACLAFVLAVNLSAPVARACARIPVLRELAEFVSVSKSLTQAVEHDYVQTVSQAQTKEGVTVSVDYLIADEKNLRVFYHVEDARPDNSGHIRAQAEFFRPDGSKLEGYYLSQTYGTDTDSGLLQIDLGFPEENTGEIPAELRLVMRTVQTVEYHNEAPAAAAGEREPEERVLGEYVFDLTIDQDRLAETKVIPIGQSLELAGQTITLERLTIYPTEARLHVTEDPDNTAWVKGLDFRLELPGGEVLDTVHNGVSATGDDGDKQYMLESPYFYEAESLRLVITGVQILDKTVEWIKVDLAAGTAEGLPTGVTYDSYTWEEGTLLLRFLGCGHEGVRFGVVSGGEAQDSRGNSYHMSGLTRGWEDETEETFSELVHIDAFPVGERVIYLPPSYTDREDLSEPLVLTFAVPKSK